MSKSIPIEKIFIGVFVLLILFGILWPIIMYYTMSFEKVITIKDKYTEARRSSVTYFIVDTNNDIYKVSNVWFKGDYNQAEDYNFMEKGKQYLVNGYGKRVRFLGWFPSIYEVKNS